MPESKFKQYWNLVITVLLIYTATYVPYKTAFVDESGTNMIVFETLIDSIFITDLFI
jgi:hypothetical protein